MKTRDLLEEIKENIKDYDIKVLEEKVKKVDINPISKQVSAYNIENYKEIISLNIDEESEENIEISDKKIYSIKKEIAKFFDGCSPESEEIFKKFIESICLYLSLIARKPLHPVGMDFSNGKTVFKEEKNNKINYYCDIKEELKMRSNEYYTCKYCICKEVK
ncbi:DUF2115 family protein [Methanobrevibacter olleyae]|uniref:UPF0305 protein SAMN02910297_01482 n=1 Tax=Methanobrevibacter olleyae TaxID=294671 RepID=A0A126R3V5_METOL|nr:DUF2115 family protein [Methanobrevibacter olleyae]AMK16355.1 hypothetical protein YLM1_1800 [Methanobrevibacter olleyae]SFL67653.1 Uncharacterized protein, UPF0305 family [Methanobrevibacter olleyae]